MKKYRNFISFIISFLLMIMVIASILVVFLKDTLLNDEYYIRVLDKQNVSRSVYDEIKKQLEYPLLANNIPRDLLDGVISEQEVRNEIEDIVVDICEYFRGDKKSVEKFNAEKYKNRCSEALNKYLTDKKIDLTEESKKDLAAIIDDSAEVVSTEIEWMNYSKLCSTNAVSSIRDKIIFLDDRSIIYALGVLQVACIVLLFLMWKNRKHRACAWLGYSLISAGLMLFIVFFSGYVSGFYENINFLQPQLKIVICEVLETMMVSLSKYGAIIAVLGIVFLSVYWRHLYRRNKREKMMLND